MAERLKQKQRVVRLVESPPDDEVLFVVAGLVLELVGQNNPVWQETASAKRTILIHLPDLSSAELKDLADLAEMPLATDEPGLQLKAS